MKQKTRNIKKIKNKTKKKKNTHYKRGGIPGFGSKKKDDDKDINLYDNIKYYIDDFNDIYIQYNQLSCNDDSIDSDILIEYSLGSMKKIINIIDNEQNLLVKGLNMLGKVASMFNSVKSYSGSFIIMYNELVYNNIIQNKIGETFSEKDKYKMYYSIAFLGLYTYKNPTLFVNEDFLDFTLGTQKKEEKEKSKDDSVFDIGKMLGDVTNGVINGLGKSNTINSGKTACNLMPEWLQPNKYCPIVKLMEKKIEEFKKDENYEFQENPVTVFIIYRFIKNISIFKVPKYKRNVYEDIKYDYDFSKMYEYINSKCENKEENKEYSTIKFFEKEKEKDPNAKTFPEFVKNYFNKNKKPLKIVYKDSSCNDINNDCNECNIIDKMKEKKPKKSWFSTKTDEEE